MPSPPAPPPTLVALLGAVGQSSISVVFALALLWWVLEAQSKALERIASQQVVIVQTMERLSARIDASCAPSTSQGVAR